MVGRRPCLRNLPLSEGRSLRAEGARRERCNAGERAVSARLIAVHDTGAADAESRRTDFRRQFRLNEPRFWFGRRCTSPGDTAFQAAYADLPSDKGRLGVSVLLLGLCFAFAGCAPAVAPPAARPVMVSVPIPTPIYCAVPALPAPALAIASLTADSPPADTIRDYAATVEVLKSAVRERDAILKGCEAPEEPQKQPVSKNSVPLPPRKTPNLVPLPAREGVRG